MKLADQDKIEIKEALDRNTARSIYKVMEFLTYQETTRYLGMNAESDDEISLRVRKARLEGYEKLTNETIALISKIQQGGIDA